MRALIGVAVLVYMAVMMIIFTQIHGPGRPLPWGSLRYDDPPRLPTSSLPAIFLKFAYRRRHDP